MESTDLAPNFNWLTKRSEIIEQNIRTSDNGYVADAILHSKHPSEM
jgi:hypothetical protein